jgi:hypothetical protein
MMFGVLKDVCLFGPSKNSFLIELLELRCSIPNASSLVPSVTFQLCFPHLTEVDSDAKKCLIKYGALIHVWLKTTFFNLPVSVVCKSLRNN